MPKAVSKKQQRWFFAAEARGQLKKGTAKRHARKGKAYKKLPMRVKKRKTTRARRRRRRR
jgi:hypothetical protein